MAIEHTPEEMNLRKQLFLPVRSMDDYNRLNQKLSSDPAARLEMV